MDMENVLTITVTVTVGRRLVGRKSMLRYRWQCRRQMECPGQELADFVTDRGESSVFLSEEVFGSTD